MLCGLVISRRSSGSATKSDGLPNGAPPFRDIGGVGTEIATDDAPQSVTARTKHDTVVAWLEAARSSSSADEAARRLILAAADRVCTSKQRAALVHHLDGKSTVQIASAMGVSQSTAYRHLFGDPRDGHGGGAIEKLRGAMKEGASMVRGVLDEVAAEDVTPNTSEVVAAWFAGLTPLRYGLFGPLTVLLVANTVADAKRSISIADLYLYVPRPFVTAALGQLRAAGYIATDGITITIRKTPLDEMKERRQ